MGSEVTKNWSLLVILQCLKCVSLILKWGFIIKKAIRFSFGAVEDIVNSNYDNTLYPIPNTLTIYKIYKQENENSN